MLPFKAGETVPVTGSSTLVWGKDFFPSGQAWFTTGRTPALAAGHG